MTEQVEAAEERRELEFAATKDEHKVLLTIVVIQLPEDMQYLYGQIEYGHISTLGQVLIGVKKKQEAYGRSFSCHERHSLRKQAHERV